ncbi:hypothetical protein RF55_11242 [Lasius niger]|uniref:Uncharacterized protein n=1 Tax=Lasius niger TaxID=67767 RepID=A0A0J7N926_LASNI|nr:hypothetical protein RF55_11242 [Lasius niger]
MAKAREKGNPAYWRKKCDELGIQSLSSERKLERLENDLDEHKMEVDSLMKENDGLIKEKEGLIKRNIGVNTSPRKEKTREDTNEQTESPPPRVVMRPALKGISKPVPTMPKLPRDKLDEIQEDMVRHLETIYKLREELDSNAGNVHVKGTSRKEEWPLPGPSRNKEGKLGEREKGGKETQKDKIKDREGAVRRAPRTAAISIKSNEKEFSYAQALKVARDKIDLSAMGIESSRIRKAANGGIIIEIPGKDGTAKADELMDKIQEVFKKGNVKAVVKRPTVKGELRVYGFDDSVQAEDIREEISKKGCLEKDIDRPDQGHAKRTVHCLGSLSTGNDDSNCIGRKAQNWLDRG